MAIGYFDYIVFITLIILNIVFWKKDFTSCLAYCIIALLFGIIFPLVSSFIDIKIYTSGKKIVDNFELLYNYLKFPIYWGIGLLQLLVLRIK
jgi:hypothetical protein